MPSRIRTGTAAAASLGPVAWTAIAVGAVAAVTAAAVYLRRRRASS